MRVWKSARKAGRLHDATPEWSLGRLRFEFSKDKEDAAGQAKALARGRYDVGVDLIRSVRRRLSEDLNDSSWGSSSRLQASKRSA